MTGSIVGITGCDLERIDRFLQSDQYHLDDAGLISHLDSCESCRAYIEGQSASAVLRNVAQQLLQPDEFDTARTIACSAATLEDHSGHQSAAVQEAMNALTPSDYPDHLGRIGTYEVTGVVGIGAMGIVFKAIDPTLDRVVALKMMAPRLANNEVARKRFLREAKAAAAVLHPNVIPIHSVSSDSTIPYLVMSYIRGGSLQKRLKSEGSLPLIEVLRIGSQIATGLHAAHAKGLVHRDIKPENVLLEEGVERVTITDFGLARAVDDNTVTQQGTIAGTPMYMSPEQARGEQVDQQSDLFSLGSVLYALATGQAPFQADTSYAVMRRIIDEKPTPMQQLNPDIPDWFAKIVDLLMAKKKADRFKSAADLHTLLDGCLSHLQQPETIMLPNISKSHAKDLAVPEIDREQKGEKQKGERSRFVLPAAIVTMLLGAITAFLASPVDTSEGPYMVGGGSAVSSEGWYFTSGSTYLQQDEPGVLFGMYEDASGSRNLSYVVLFQHNVIDSTKVAHASNSGLTFDGHVATMKSGITIDRKSIKLALTIRLDQDKRAIESARLSFNDENLDYTDGRLLLVDLTSDSIKCIQVKAKFPSELPDPRKIASDTEAVSELAKQLAQLDGVRQFLAPAPTAIQGNSSGNANSDHPETTTKPVPKPD